MGDFVIANGLIYETPTIGAAPIGTFDLSAFTTSMTNTTERRQVFIETSFTRSFKQRSWLPKLSCDAPKNGALNQPQTDDIGMMGVETYPLGGGILTNPLVFGITAGTGLFVGEQGSVHISYDPRTEFFKYVFTLLPRDSYPCAPT